MKKILMITLLWTAIAMPAMADGTMCQENAAKKAGMMIGDMDTDGDGLASMKEHEAYSSSEFFNTDTDRDGLLSYEELAASIGKQGTWEKKKGIGYMIKSSNAPRSVND